MPTDRYPELAPYRCPDCPPAPGRCYDCATDKAAVRALVVLKRRLDLCRQCDDPALHGRRLCLAHSPRRALRALAALDAVALELVAAQ